VCFHDCLPSPSGAVSKRLFLRLTANVWHRDITLADTHTMAASHGDFSDLLKVGKLAIEPHPALTAAARHAMTRPLSGAEALERRKPTVDTSPIVASELAVWAVLHVERRATRIHVYDPTWKGSKEAAR
jgi:hypothetical protein